MAERKKGKGSKRSRHEWRTLLAAFDGSGLGIDAFCCQRRFKTDTPQNSDFGLCAA
jgi:hypothetical protein